MPTTMRRKALDQLLAWNRSDSAKPLLVYGARQVGKTFLVRDVFGASEFENVCDVNFERDGEVVRQVFRHDLNPRRIIADLSLVKDVDIKPGTTLILLDEVQLCEEALTSLKYFAEEAPDFRVVAAGSLLGVRLHRERGDGTFPVGKVDVMRMFPMDFEEYLWAQGKTRVADGIRAAFGEGRAFLLHEEALRLYREYVLVGGMPEAVSKSLGGEGVVAARAVHQNLSVTYASDVARYIGDISAARTMELWDSIPLQLMRENHKFKFSDVRKGARRSQYEGSFAWLESAGLIYRCSLTHDGEPPFLAPGGESDSFKAYLLDVGLLSSAWRVDPRLVVEGKSFSSALSPVARRALAENYVMQSLQSNGIQPLYWKSKRNAEVDFLFSNDAMHALPIEVKSGENVRSRSLGMFRDKYDPALCLRVSAKNFGVENGITSVPLYAAFCIDRSLGAKG